MFWAVYYPVPVGVTVAAAVVAACVSLAWALAGVVVPICAGCRYLAVQLPTEFVTFCIRLTD